MYTARLSWLGFITGSLASWFIDRFSELEMKESETRDDVGELLTEVRGLRAELGAMRIELADLRSAQASAARRHPWSRA